MMNSIKKYRSPYVVFLPVAGVDPTTTFSSMLLNEANLMAYPDPAPSNSL